MMLWDIIRDFFVQNIFGGIDSSLTAYGGLIGMSVSSELSYYESYSDNLAFRIGDSILMSEDSTINFISIGDWLSTTATIIVLIALCFFLFLVLRYIFKLFGGLFAH